MEAGSLEEELSAGVFSEEALTEELLLEEEDDVWEDEAR